MRPGDGLIQAAPSLLTVTCEEIGWTVGHPHIRPDIILRVSEGVLG